MHWTKSHYGKELLVCYSSNFEFLISIVLRVSKFPLSHINVNHFCNLKCLIPILKRIKGTGGTIFDNILRKHIADSHVLLHTSSCYTQILLAHIALLKIHAWNSLMWVLKDCGYSFLTIFSLLAFHTEADWLILLDRKVLST